MNDAERGLFLAREYFRLVWSPPHDVDALDDMVTPDFTLHNAGASLSGRDAFKRWVRQMQSTIADVHNEHLDLFADADGSRIVSRWRSRGRNMGMYGSPPDGRAVEYTGISIWRVRDGLLSELWAERSAYELSRTLLG